VRHTSNTVGPLVPIEQATACSMTRTISSISSSSG
jgi:hypothetical protein